MVSGTEVYKVAVKVGPVSKGRWGSICRDCAGAIDSLVELLQGRFSKAVMERICRANTGLFPAPAEIEFSCSCPDWASMCKHVAAVLYGIGARLDTQPELLFKLRKVAEKELLAKAGAGVPLAKKGLAAHKVLAAEGLSDIFGLDMAENAAEPAAETPPAPGKRARGQRAKQLPAKPGKSREASARGSRSPKQAKNRKSARAGG